MRAYTSARYLPSMSLPPSMPGGGGGVVGGGGGGGGLKATLSF